MLNTLNKKQKPCVGFEEKVEQGLQGAFAEIYYTLKDTAEQKPQLIYNLQKNAKEFWDLTLARKENFAIATSGGKDSMSLAITMQRLGANIECIVINHNLRAESATEALKTHQILKSYGIKVTILNWIHKEIKTGIEERARKERYKLLTQFCKNKQIRYLLTGHHLNDQTETVLINLARGSGIDGLSGIKALSTNNKINIIRPMLNITREEVNVFIEENSIPYITDPSNQDIKITRNMLRICLLKITNNQNQLDRRIAKVATFMQEESKLISVYINNLTRRFEKQNQHYIIPATEYCKLQTASRKRLIIQCVANISNAKTKPLEKSVNILISQIESLQKGKKTLMSATIVWNDNSVELCKTN
ncbi:MAG: tRNA lysidine(34) synthetase TilS [Alphaproteobacteria bacterium]|nr:tRNA lysidine(34) synthetase TilS [Rickettsiales bacterium]